METLNFMERILVIQTAFIGDAILTLPMIEKLKQKHNSCLIDILCIPSTEEIFSASPFVNEVLVMDKKDKHKSLFSLVKFTKELRSRNYDKIFSPHRSFRTSFIVMQSGVKETYGFSNAAFFHVYKNIVEYGFGKHEVQRNLDLIDFKYDDENWQIIPQLKINENVVEKVKKFLSENKFGDKIIAIAPGSVWETKKYPINYFSEIISCFVEKSYKILLIGGEDDKNLCESLAREYVEYVLSAAGLFSLIETVELLKHVMILLSNDSAPTHLGVCADVPVLTIFCSTVPGFGFFPYNKKSFYISYDDLNCKPCGLHGFMQCPINSFDCGFKLKPQMLITKMEEMLGVES